ncbi:PH domain-containing protein [Streptomyces sp. NPDC003077]|uniref:PH domain-containing protein n=1 Tax=Streptomyces sp. NPDC003077 TaxID=3154443 RepID=UPI00339E2D38
MPDTSETGATGASGNPGHPSHPDNPGHRRERRLHPVTPLRRAWAPIAVVVGLVKQDWLRDWALRLDRGWLVAGMVLLVVASVTYGVESWRRTYYALTDTELRIRSGLLFRRAVHIRLERLQAVEIAEPLLARLLGIAKLKLDVIGTEDKDELAYLGRAHARALRAELLALAAGFTPASAETAGEAPVREVTRVAPRMLGVAVLLNGALLSAVFGCAVAAGLVWWVTHSFWAAAAGVASLLGVLWAATGGRFLSEYDWTVGESPDGLRLDHGLLDRKHETVPPGRVQAVRIIRPLLWRPKGWMRIELDVAGSSNDVLLPVADQATARMVLQYVLSGVDVDAVRAALRPAPRRARFAAPVFRRGYGWAADGAVFAASTGVLKRTLTLVPHAKVQSVRLGQGPWQRRLDLAHVSVDTGANTTVVARLRPAAEARRIVTEQAERSRTGRREALPDRWMRREGADASA